MDEQKKESIFSKFFKQSSHYLIGNIAMMISGFLSMPILTRAFSKSDYGVMSLISVMLVISFALSKAGTTEAAVRFYSEFKDGKRKCDISVFYTTLFFGTLIFALVIAGIISIGANIFFRNVSDLTTNNLILVIALLIIFGSLFARFTNFMRAEQNTKVLNTVLVLRRYIGISLGIAFIFIFSENIISFFSGQLFTDIFFIFILLTILLKNKKIKLSSFSISFFKECLRFGIPLIGLELGDFLVKSSDRYLIQIFLGAEAVGSYSVGSNLCHYIRDALMYPLSYAITPLYIDMWSKKGEDETKKFVSNIFHFYLVISIPIIFGFIALSKQIVVTLASAKYIEATSVIPYIIIGAVAWGYFPIFAAGLFIKKQTHKLKSLIFIGVGINIVLNIFLIPKMNLEGAALASLIAYLSLIALLIKKSMKYLKIKINFSKVLKVLCSSTVMFLILQNIQIGTGIISLMIKTMTGIFIYGFLMIIIDKQIRQFLYKVLNGRLYQIKASLANK